jgi:hypothetical protein
MILWLNAASVQPHETVPYQISLGQEKIKLGSTHSAFAAAQSQKFLSQTIESQGLSVFLNSFFLSN